MNIIVTVSITTEQKTALDSYIAGLDSDEKSLTLEAILTKRLSEYVDKQLKQADYIQKRDIGELFIKADAIKKSEVLTILGAK